MKLGLISDVHGDFVALELAWAHLMLLGAERIVCAGDLVGYGPFPDGVATFMKERQILSVRGNHDRWAIERGPDFPDEYRGGTPNEETVAFLETLPFDLAIEGAGKVGVIVHATLEDDLEFVTPSRYTGRVLEGWLKLVKADFIVTGHTHRPMWYRCKSGLVVNPGSVICAPVVETSRTCALLDLATLDVTFHDVDSGARVNIPEWPA